MAFLTMENSVRDRSTVGAAPRLVLLAFIGLDVRLAVCLEVPSGSLAILSAVPKTCPPDPFAWAWDQALRHAATTQNVLQRARLGR